MKKIIASLSVVALLLMGTPVLTQGATIPKVPALFTSSLLSRIESSATSMTLVSGRLKNGAQLSGYTCFTIDEGSSQEEFVCGLASSTSVTSMIRGIDPLDGDLEVTSLKKSHNRGASVKVTNYPVLGILARILNGDETIPNVLRYASGVTTSSIYANGQNLVSVSTLQDTVASGAVNASETTKGISELATDSELADGTASGGTGARLVAPGSLFGATSSAQRMVPVTNASGTLSPGFIDQTASYDWSGTTTFSGQVAGNNPVVRTYTTTSTTSTWNKPANLKYVVVEVQSGGGGGQTVSSGAGYGGAAGCYAKKLLLTANVSSTVTITVGGGGAAAGTGGSSSFGSFVTATGGQSTSTASGACTTTGGDYQVIGQVGITGIAAGTPNAGGVGGNSFLGFGGNGARQNSGSAGGVDGVDAAQGYGGGGGGAAGGSSGSGTGGRGAQGIVIITEHYL